MTNTVATVSFVVNKRKRDTFSVGDLVTACSGRLIYIIVNKDNAYPLRAGRGTLKGILIGKIGSKDNDGDPLPDLGYLHDNLSESSLKPFYGTVELKGYKV